MKLNDVEFACVDSIIVGLVRFARLPSSASGKVRFMYDFINELWRDLLKYRVFA